jgi:hypothetical protein
VVRAAYGTSKKENDMNTFGFKVGDKVTVTLECTIEKDNTGDVGPSTLTLRTCADDIVSVMRFERDGDWLLSASDAPLLVTRFDGLPGIQLTKV